ncbi:hypothetical protein V8G54_034429 [Vigna mungo]|uniref:Uncharacterized protein n=1 Tax=Vigna mungo TaxID=3915 RepID=A0AAQ3MQM6_VIGMU
MMAVVSGSGRLQHLDLNLNYNCPIPSFVFCKTLVVLKLTDILVLDNFFVDLPLLKMLYLNDVMLPKYLDLSHVLCGCPNLEDLELNDMDCEIKGKINRFPNLVRASINNGILPLELFKDVHVLKFDWIMSLTKDWLRVLKVLNHCPKLQSLFIGIHKV